MGFVTKLDYSNNRQIRQRVETQTQLSGGTTFGVPYTDLIRGVDESTVQLTSTSTGVTSTFSGNTGTTIFYFGDSRMELAGGDLEPITPSNSGDTQNAGPAYTGATFTTVDNNTVTLTYSGIGYNLLVTSIEEVSAGNYTGTTTSDLNFYSGDTADYTGSTVWVTSEDSARVKGTLYANILDVNEITGAGASGFTNTYTSGVTLNGNTLEFDRSDLANAYNVDLTPIITGATSGLTTDDIINENYINSGDTLTTKLDSLDFRTLAHSSTGVITGMNVIVDSGATTFSVGTGQYQVVDNVGFPPNREFILYGGTSGNTVPLGVDTTYWILIDENEVITTQVTFPTPEEYRDRCLIGGVVVRGGIILFDLDNKLPVLSHAALIQDMAGAIGRINASGNEIYAPATNLTLAKNAGTLYVHGTNLHINPKNPSYKDIPSVNTNAGDTFISVTSDAIIDLSGTTVDVGNYQPNGVGGLVSIPGGSNTSGNWFIFTFEGGDMVLVYPQAIYGSLNDARLAIGTDLGNLILPDIFAETGFLLGVVTIRKAAINLQSSTDAIFTLASKFGEFGPSGSGGGTTDLQTAYSNSAQPQITTDAVRGALQIRQGSGSDEDSIMEGLDGAGTATFELKGEGAMLMGTNHVLGSGSTTSVLLAGDDNEITDGFHNGIIGGNENLIQGSSNLTTILGGYQNIITGSTYSGIIGTVAGTVQAVGSVIAGGASNTLLCGDSAIIGGSTNLINSGGGNNVIVGGGGNIITTGIFNTAIIGATGLTGDTPNTTYTKHLKTNGTDIAATSKGYEGLDSGGNEIYSLRNDGSIVQKANSSAIADGQLFNNSFNFYIQSGELKARGKDNLGIPYDVTIGGGAGGGDDTFEVLYHTSALVTTNTFFQLETGFSTNTSYPVGEDLQLVGIKMFIQGPFSTFSAASVWTVQVRSHDADGSLTSGPTTGTGTLVATGSQTCDVNTAGANRYSFSTPTQVINAQIDGTTTAKAVTVHCASQNLTSLTAARVALVFRRN